MEININPDILSDISANMGRIKLSQKYNISDELARFYIKLVDYDKPIEKLEDVNIVLFDIETLPIESYTWGLYKQNISINQIKRDMCLLSYSYKTLHSKYIYGDILTPGEAVKRDDKRIVEGLWQVFDNADVVIAHNGDKFDIRVSNSRFLKHGMRLPSSYRTIDTLKAVRQRFKLTSNKLDYIAQYLEVGRKIDTTFNLWKGCSDGDKKSLKQMLKYNKMDVEVLENVYLEIRGYIKNHPILGNITDNNNCPVCGSSRLVNDGYYYTKLGKYDAYYCPKCKAVLHNRTNLNRGNKNLRIS